MSGKSKSIKSGGKNTAANFSAEHKLCEEDGWIFRERPGLPVECLGRAKDLKIADLTQS